MCKVVLFKAFYDLCMVRFFAIISAIVLTTLSATAGNIGLKSLAKPGLGQIWPAVGRLTLDGGQGFCTASLIAPDIILTAAHCLYDEKTGDEDKQNGYDHLNDALGYLCYKEFNMIYSRAGNKTGIRIY